MSKSGEEYKPGLLLRLPGLALLIGIAVSGALHMGLLVYAFDKPIGYVDPNDLAAMNAPVRIKRATYDKIIDDIGAGDGNQNAGIGTGQQSKEKDLSDQGADLLAETEVEVIKPAFDPKLEIRDAEAADTDLDDKEFAVKLPEFELPEEAILEMEERPLDDPGFRDAEDVGFSVDSVTSLNSSDRALEMLSGSGYGGAFGPGAPGPRTGKSRRSHRLASSISRPNAASDRIIDNDKVVRTNANEIPLDSLIDLPDSVVTDDGFNVFLKPQPLDSDFDYLVSTFQNRNEPGYFEIEISALRSLAKLPTMNKDVVFLVDTSSSIDQEWVNQVMRGVRPSIRTLNPDDRFNIVLFNERIRLFSEDGPKPATLDNINKAMAFLSKAESKGATDVNSALSQLLSRDLSPNRVYDIVLITDGLPTRGVMDTRKLINLITRDNDLNASIYCVGIGRKQNRELLNFLAYRNKGYSVFVDQRGKTMDVILDLMSRLRYPIIKDLRVQVAGQNISEVYPLTLANIHQGENFSILGRYTQPDEFTVQVTGFNNGKPVDFTLTRDLSNAKQGDGQIAYDWAFWKLHHLYSEILRRGYSNDLKLQINKLRNRYKLKTVY